MTKAMLKMRLKEVVEGDYPSEDEELSLRINDKLSHMNAVILHYNQ